MVYIQSFSTAGYLMSCEQRKILYIYDDIIADHVFSNVIIMYCPYSKNKGS